MSKDWPYSKLTKRASEKGGPEEYIRKIATHNYEKGFQEGSRSKNKIVIATSAGVGLIVYGITYIVTKNKTTQEEIEKYTVSPKEAQLAHDELLRKIESLEKENESLMEKLSSEEVNYIDGKDGE